MKYGRELAWLVGLGCVCALGALLFRGPHAKRHPSGANATISSVNLDFGSLSIGGIQPGMSIKEVAAVIGYPKQSVITARDVNAIFEDPASRGGRGGGAEMQSVDTFRYPSMEVVFELSDPKGQDVEWVRGTTLEIRGNGVLKSDSSSEAWNGALGNPVKTIESKGLVVETWVVGPWFVSLAKSLTDKALTEQAIGLSKPSRFPTH
jgi:hypothetical protein